MSIWPRVRLRTPVKGDPFRSADQVKIMDAIIGRKHGSVTVAFDGLLCYVAGGAGQTSLGGFVDAAGEEVRVPLAGLPQGAVVTDVVLLGSNGGTLSNAPTVSLSRRVGASSNVALSTSKSVPTADGPWTVTWGVADTDIPRTLLAGELISARIVGVASQGDQATLSSAQVTFYNP
jgi:hypothetical protein